MYIHEKISLALKWFSNRIKINPLAYISDCEIYIIDFQIDFYLLALFSQVFSSYLQFCGIGLRNAQLYEKSQLEVKRNQVLLDLARMIFEEQSTIEHMVFRILTHMQSLIQCQRVQVRALFTYMR